MAFTLTQYNTNADGLTIAYGTAQGQPDNIGSPFASGSNKRVEIDMKFSDLAAFGTTNYIFGGIPNVEIPANAVIVSATFVTTTAFTGSSATLDIGLVQSDGTTEIDWNGFFAALAQTAMTPAGTPATGSGALISTKTSVAGFITTNVNTANFTAGAGRFILEYFVATP